MRFFPGRPACLAVPLLIVATASTARAQDEHDHGEGRGGPRIVEQHRWDDPEGRLMAYYSAALAFSPVGAPRVAGPWSGSVGLEVSYLPALNEAQRSGGFSKTESTNLAPVVPRPRLSLTLPAGFSVEASWIPPVRAFGVTANLVSAAVARPITMANGFVVTPRISGTTGSVTGPITCNTELEDRGGGDAIFYAHVCHSQESEDRFEPMAIGGEVVASRAIRGGAIAPYAGIGLRHERSTFDVGVRFSDGSLDPNHPILKMNLTRGYGFAGATWVGPRRSAVSGEMFYAPGSLLTARVQASVRLFGS
jgi:hypothetical protein